MVMTAINNFVRRYFSVYTSATNAIEVVLKRNALNIDIVFTYLLKSEKQFQSL